MVCSNCGQVDENNSQFCMKCGQPLQADTPSADAVAGGASQNSTPVQSAAPRRRRKALPIAIAVCVVLIAVIILMAVLAANPVAGTWYSQSGTELIFLKNGKGMAVPDGDAERIHFMYAIEYQETGYIEGEIYDKSGDPGSWFYMYDGKLEFNGETFYRQDPSRHLG